MKRTRQAQEIARNRERVPPEDQPWRCAECNTPIDPGLRMPCKCPGFDETTLDEALGALLKMRPE